MVLTSVTKIIEEDTQRAAAEVQLQKYGKFIDEYTKNLNIIEERLLPYSPNPSNLTLLINFKPEEQTSATDLINCDNKIIDKILRVFSALCSEVSYLQNEMKSKYLNLLLYYGESLEDDTSYEDCQLSVSKILVELQNLSNFIKHCERVILEIMSQLSAFYNLNLEICDANLYEVFDALSETLIILVTIQEVIANNNTLIYHWSLYKRTIQLASHSASEFPYSTSKINQLDQLITKLESELIAQKIFDGVLLLPYDQKNAVTKNKKLSEEFNSYLKNIITDLERMVQHESVESATKWAKVCIMFVLSINIFGNYDRKFLKHLSGGMKRFALITLYANVTFQIDEFLLKYTGHLLKTTEKKLLLKDNNSQQCIMEITSKLNNYVPFYALQVLSWILKIEEKIKQDISNLKIEYLRDISCLLFEGIRYASCIKTTLSTISNLYIAMKKPMTRASAVSFCKLVEILKCIEYVYYRHHMQLCKIINYIIQYTKYECVNIVNNIKKELTKDKNFKEGKVDTVSSLVIAEDSLNGPTTDLRILIAKLCMNLTGQTTCLTELEKQQFPSILQKLSIVSALQEKLHSLLECTFMYWNKGILPIYFEEINLKKQNLNRVKYLLHTLLNTGNNINSTTDDSLSIDRVYDNVNEICLKKLVVHIVDPLCGNIEENIRLHVLRHLQTDQSVIQNQNFELNNFYTTERIYFGNKYVDIKKKVEDYLNKTFYDLTTVALHNYQIHGEMKTLARDKFMLQTVDDNLPNQSLEQGLDLLEITRNIHMFVSSYFYNLNNQIFIEMGSNNKHLNTINIKHIANSIRSHGMGIMNTAVNYTYQFLCQKLNNFSQFLYDEQIKSRLLKDISIHKEQTELNQRYPFERAERFNRGIQKLGVTKDGETYLDQFRSLITQIGNALGYVRMIRSGGLHCCSNSALFIPNLKKIINFEYLCHEDGLSEVCCESAVCLDNAVNNISNRMTESTNYFKLLVDVFTPVLCNMKNNHLRNFYIIIPPLTINFIEYLITAKESMVKKNKTTACFTDDGFSMGIAYILQVLNLYSEFDSLHWFQSVLDRNYTTIEKLNKHISTASKDDIKLQHTLNLSLKRLKIYQKEFNLLYYNLYSARVLFENRNEDINKEEENSDLTQ